MGTECSLEGCAKRRFSRGMCQKHYTRWLRHGDPRRTLREGHGFVETNGYRALVRPDHPLATQYGKVYEHRLVLYAVIGPGGHMCHWCQRYLHWDTNLIVDHLDGNIHNNTPANLVPSCHACNIARSPKYKEKS